MPSLKESKQYLEGYGQLLLDMQNAWQNRQAKDGMTENEFFEQGGFYRESTVYGKDTNMPRTEVEKQIKALKLMVRPGSPDVETDRPVSPGASPTRKVWTAFKSAIGLGGSNPALPVTDQAENQNLIADRPASTGSIETKKRR